MITIDKKMLYIIIAVVLICPFFILVFSSFKTTDDLVVAPKITGEYGKIQTAFEKSVKDKTKTAKISLKYPTEGKYKNAYVLYDFDRDGKNEVLVFYTLSTDKTTVHISVLDRDKDGEWFCAEDISGYGSEVKSISFEDINKDKNYEILITWSLYDSKSSQVLTLHKVNSNNGKVYGLKALSKEPYSYYDLVDLDSDGFDEILVTKLDVSDEKPSSYVKLLKLGENSRVKTIAKKELDGSVSSYSSMKVQMGNQNSPTLIFIDAYKGDKQMITEVVYWDKDTTSLKVPFLDEKTLSNIKTLRTPPIESMDINNDNKIEIPISPQDDDLKEINLSDSYVKTNDVVLGITKWCAFENNKLVPKKQSIVNSSDYYIFMIDEEYNDKLIAKKNLKNRRLTVCTKAKKVDNQKELFSIIAVPVSEWTSNPTEGYSILKRNDSLVYAYKIERVGASIGITPERLAPNIKIIK